MKKPTYKRLGLGFLQHLAAMFIMVALAGILFNSYIAVDTMDGSKVYWLSPLDTEPEFEDSVVFRDLFRTAVSDITRLVVIKGQVETDGEFDSHKKIDVTQFANRKGTGNGCNVTVYYELEDLIKWGKYGIEYTNRAMSMSDFVNYFGPATSPVNFALDANGNLYFAGFYDVAFLPEIPKTSIAFQSEEAIAAQSRSSEEMEQLNAELQKYTVEQLEDMAFSYIMSETSEDISLIREEDGSLTVYFSMINGRYSTVDDEKQLTAYAGNWVDYTKLQSNLEEAITSLSANYEMYQNCNHLYLENKGNIKYVVRMMTDDGIRTYTNVSDMQDAEEIAITDYFAEYRRYLIYYPDSLEFTGNTSMTEDEIYEYLNAYEYVYPETTHIWIGVDTNYAVAGDALYNANTMFQRIVPNIGYIIAFCVIMGLLWLMLGIYLTLTAGVAYDENNERVVYMNGIDHLWTEFMLLIGVGCVYGAYRGYQLLSDVADMVYSSHSELLGASITQFYEYGSFAAYGFLVSMVAAILWYSLIRRIRSKNLWRDSFICWLLNKFSRGVRFVISHRNTAVSTLIPYNLFLLVNLVGVFYALKIKESNMISFLILVGIVIFDGVIGVLIFKNKAEHLDIVDGIRRIRDGEVEYKLDVESLHGDNREMADAVNNIGEGIRKAVRTSMKDEQMKTDLITNVSHDIKTPLTSIINYVDLLKRLKITEEPAKSYIDILDNKSQRLKQLADDLVEASKISSGNIELNFEKLNLTELINQAVGEFIDRLEEKNLTVVFDGGTVPAIIYADSRRMWRVVENLFNNVCKYAMEGTRVYLDIIVAEGNIEMSMKNISERQMNIRADDLTERFIRGDASRTTEGSGLGLFIAKSFTQVQGGSFEIQLDGDLFKVMLRFSEYVEPDEEHQSAENVENLVSDELVAAETDAEIAEEAASEPQESGKKRKGRRNKEKK